MLKPSKQKFSNSDIRIQRTGDINRTNLQRFEAVLIYEPDSNVLPLRKRVTVESMREAFVFASCCYRWHSPSELNVCHLTESVPLEQFFGVMFLIEKVKKAALNQQVSSFLKILSLPGPQPPLVAKTLSLLVYKKSESLKVYLRRRYQESHLISTLRRADIADHNPPPHALGNNAWFL